MDFTFHDTDNVYGIPEHADKFSLQDTSNSDPYRLYNLDVFEYELWNPMALYAAVPFMVGHNAKRTTGVFWLNAAETWIDVRKSSNGVLSSLKNLVSSSQPRVDTHWMSETGIIDAFVLLGPKPKDVSRQYMALTGPTPLPPEFSIAYHQCRWNYNDQKDVVTVSAKFDEHDIPMDIMWLDIEHTDGKKYFTWDSRKFPDSLGMVQVRDGLSMRFTQPRTCLTYHLCHYQIQKSRSVFQLFHPESDFARKEARDDRRPPHQEGHVVLGAQGLHGQGPVRQEQGRRRLRGLVLARRLLLPRLPQRRRQAVLCGAVQAGKLPGN